MPEEKRHPRREVLIPRLTANTVQLANRSHPDPRQSPAIAAALTPPTTAPEAKPSGVSHSPPFPRETVKTGTGASRSAPATQPTPEHLSSMLNELRRQEQELENDYHFLRGFEQDMSGGQPFYQPDSEYQSSTQAKVKLDQLRRQIQNMEADLQKSTYHAVSSAEDFHFTAEWTRMQTPASMIPIWQGNLGARSVVRAIQTAEQRHSDKLSDASQLDRKWDHMTRTEQDILLYYAGKGHWEQAEAYLNWLEDAINQRQGLQTAQAIRDIPSGPLRAGATGLHGLASGIDRFGSGIAQLFSSDRLPTSATQYASQSIRDNLANSGPTIAGQSAGQLLYDTAAAVGSIAPSILTSVLTGGAAAPAAGAASMGLSSVGNTYAQALDRGHSKEHARTYALLEGGSEWLTQYLLGGIGKLGGIAWNQLLPKAAAFDSGLKRALATTGVKLGGEIMEELLQNHVLEPFFQSLVLREDFDLPTIEELAHTTIVTALTTGVLEAGEIAGAGKPPLKVENSQRKEYDTTKDLKPQKLLDELSKSGVKYTAEQVIMVTKLDDGMILWLEQGDSKSGLTHIIERHAGDFKVQDTSRIPSLLRDVLDTIPIKTGSNSKGRFADYVFGHHTYRVAYGTNGYIVSFFPID